MSNDPAKPQRKIWHYVSLNGYRSADTSKHTDSLMKALQGWIADATSDRRRKPLRPYLKLTEQPRSMDECRGDVAAALACCEEWDGFLLAEFLLKKGWPADADLVHVIHRWSCELKSAAIKAWLEKKKMAEARR